MYQAVKWLSQTNGNQIIIEYSILTEKYPAGLSDNRRNRLMKQKAYSNTGHILDGNGWYDSKYIELLSTYYKRLVDIRNM